MYSKQPVWRHGHGRQHSAGFFMHCYAAATPLAARITSTSLQHAVSIHTGFCFSAIQWAHRAEEQGIKEEFRWATDELIRLYIRVLVSKYRTFLQRCNLKKKVRSWKFKDLTWILPSWLGAEVLWIIVIVWTSKYVSYFMITVTFVFHLFYTVLSYLNKWLKNQYHFAHVYNSISCGRGGGRGGVTGTGDWN